MSNLSTKDVCIRMNKSRQQVYDYIDRGYLKAENVTPHMGRPSYVIKSEDLDAFIESREKKGKPDE